MHGQVSIPSYRRVMFNVATAVVKVAMIPVAEVRIDDIEVRPYVGSGLIIASNHRSYLDFFVGILAFRKWGVYPHVMVRRDFFKVPLLGLFLRGLGALPARREWRGTALAQVKELLRSGHVVVITPEGRIPSSQERVRGIGRVRHGIGRLAVAHGTPILLAGVVNTDVAWSPGAPLPKTRMRRSNRPVIRVSAELLSVRAEDSAVRVVEEVENGLRRILAKLEQ